MLWSSKKLKRERPRLRRTLGLAFEPMEGRLLLSTTPQGIPTLSTNAEVSDTYDTNSYMAVTGSTSHLSGYESWGFLQYGASSAVFGADAGVSAVNSVSINIYNTATSGEYAPSAGNFSIYVLPNESINPGNVRFQNGNVGSASLGTTSGGPTTVGLPGNTDAANSGYLVGTWTATSLASGYTTFTSTPSGTTTSGGGTTGTSSGLGTQAAQTIAYDLNNNVPIQLAVVADDTGFAADWEGNYSRDQPQLTLGITEVPKISLSSPTYTVDENDQNPANSTPLSFTVDDTPNPAGTTTIIDWTATSTNVPSADFTPQSGVLTFTNNASPQTGTINFKDIVATMNSGTVTITLTDDPSDTSNPVIPASGATAIGTINYIQSTNVGLSTSSVSLNETAGTATITVSRTGNGVSSTATSVNYSTADGPPYQSDNQSEDNAEAGRDYTAESGTLTWAAGDTSSRTITVPIADVKTFAGTRYFTISLSGANSGSALGPISQATVTITDNTVAGSTVYTGTPDASLLGSGYYGSSGVETSGPYYTDSYAALVSTPSGSFGYSTMPVFDYDAASSAFPTSSVGAVDSLQLSIFNTATTGGYGGTPGSFNVYLLTDNTVADTSLRYEGGTGNTGPTVIGSQASPILLGSATFPNNYVGYNNFTFDLPAGSAAQNAVDAAVNGGELIRVAITPSAGSPVTADWEGDYFDDQPTLTLLTESASLPSWLAPGSAATWNASTKTLTVTGAATIDADPGTDSPNIVASGSAAVLTIQPATVGFVNLGGITLTNGASIVVPSVGASRTHTNHNVIVLDSNGTTVPTFSIDSSSKLDLQDNDLIVQNGGSELSTIQAEATEGRDYPNNDWMGNGLTSSAAATNDANAGFEQYVLGVALNGNLPSGPYSSWQAGSSTVSLGTNDVIVKYTYNGDFTLDGMVDASAAGIIGAFYGTTSGADLTEGDTDGNGTVDDNDVGFLDAVYGEGTGGFNGNQL
jgi:hypothetical protein